MRVPSVRDLIAEVRTRYRRLRLREGHTLTRFIAKDVRRDILIVSTARVGEGYIAARVRTINVLYVAKGLAVHPDFGPLEELRIDEMWGSSGQHRGGLPDGTSIAEAPRRSSCNRCRARRLKRPH